MDCVESWLLKSSYDLEVQGLSIPVQRTRAGKAQGGSSEGMGKSDDGEMLGQSEHHSE